MTSILVQLSNINLWRLIEKDDYQKSLMESFFRILQAGASRLVFYWFFIAWLLYRNLESVLVPFEGYRKPKAEDMLDGINRDT